METIQNFPKITKKDFPLLNKNLENGKERKQEKCNGVTTVDHNTKENVLSGYGFSKVFTWNYNFLEGLSN